MSPFLCLRWLLPALLLVLTGCAGADEAANTVPGLDAPSRTGTAELAPLAANVSAVQLYRTGSESAPPIIQLGTGQSLTLEFDLLEPDGQPLEVHFDHANRLGERDQLQPIQFMRAFTTESLQDYRPSRGTDVPYVHYEYRFPNNNIQFEISGAYRLRVTAPGDGAVLFEKLFYISEEVGEVGLGVDAISGGASRIAQPIAQFVPPEDLRDRVFDFYACFARNGRFDRPRCSNTPPLVDMTYWIYRLPPEASFAPEVEGWTLDLSALRAGGSIEDVNYEARPPDVVLEPDHALLGGDRTLFETNGQALIGSGVRDQASPDVQAPYVTVRFRMVPPDERPMGEPVFVIGAFNEWQLRRDYQLTWNPAEAVYETTLLLKQGVYPYRYTTRSGRGFEGGARSPENLYTTFVYFFDIRLNTDRLLAARSVLAP